MNKICTSIEQSDKLIKLGIDVNTADMLYCIDYDGDLLSTIFKQYSGSFKYQQELTIPAWSLSALLDVLPYSQLSKDKLGGDKEGWMVSVYPNDCRYDSFWHDNPVDACYEMLIRLHEQKLL